MKLNLHLLWSLLTLHAIFAFAEPLAKPRGSRSQNLAKRTVATGVTPSSAPWVIGQEPTGEDVTIAIVGNNLVVNFPAVGDYTYDNAHVWIGPSTQTPPGAPGNYPYTSDNGFCTLNGATATCTIPISDITDPSTACGKSFNIVTHASVTSPTLGTQTGTAGNETGFHAWWLYFTFIFTCPVTTTTTSTTTTSTTTISTTTTTQPTTTTTSTCPTTTKPTKTTFSTSCPTSTKWQTTSTTQPTTTTLPKTTTPSTTYISTTTCTFTESITTTVASVETHGPCKTYTICHPDGDWKRPTWTTKAHPNNDRWHGEHNDNWRDENRWGGGH